MKVVHNSQLALLSQHAQKRVRQLDDALLIQRLMGVRQAAEYLRKMGWGLHQAKWALLGK